MALEPLADLCVVDLFAGSGALGIEALSRGARRVDFVEADARARRVLEGEPGNPRSRITFTGMAAAAAAGIEALHPTLREADLVLADPPYGGREANGLLASLGVADRLRAQSRVVIEHHAKDELPDQVGVLHCERRRRYGETVVSLYRVSAGAESGDQEER